MDYERIDRPLGGGGGGGFSPKKLRSMLMGVEKKRKDGDELGSKFNLRLRSHGSEIDESGGMSSDSCKDVDVVSVLPDCSTSTRADSLGFEMGADRRFKDHHTVNSRVRSMDNPSLDYDSSHDGISTSVSPSVFEFQKTERAHQRVPVAPFSKPAPSKWDDAQKWIASPTSNRPKAGQGQVHGGQGAGSRKGIGYFRQSSTKVVVEVPDPKGVASEEPDTKRIDTNHAKKENGGQKFVSWEADPYPIADSYGKSVAMIESSLGESEINLSRHDSGVAIHSATTFIPSPTARSVSMRDMGTDMTPIASQEPSRNGTPVRATTPMRSPDSSRPTTPGRRARASTTTDLPNDHTVSNNDLSEKELQMKTRREIIALGTQLGKMNIAAWASKEEEDKDASASLKNVAAEQQPKSATELRAAAWEEAEKAKYIARFKREEMKIQAWENHQKAKAEAEMKKIEVEVERMQGRAHDKLMNKLAATRIKAEEKLAAAEAKRKQQAARTDKQRESIRKTGRISSSISLCGWCS